MKTLRLFSTFYRSFAIFSALINISCFSILHQWGAATFNILFWFKMITLAITYSVVNTVKHKEYHYYKNLGLSKTQLWVATLGFDVVIFMVLALLILTIR